MNKFGLLLGLLLTTGSSVALGQLEKSIILNEVVTDNKAGLQDEYGHCSPWIEIANVSHTTYNIRGMYLTTDRSVLDKNMSVPERVKRMCMIPNGEPRTSIGGRQHLLFFCNSNPAQGSFYLPLQMEPGKPVWIALYNGNATDLLDSVTVPALAADLSYARKNGNTRAWQTKPADAVTPGISNHIEVSESKIAKLKREDPHGYGISVLAMGIVFFCLALLFVFFTLFGLFMRHINAAKKVANMQPLKVGVKTVEKTTEIGHKTSVILQDGFKTKGIDKEIYIAVISMALHEYQNNVHDMESGVITIKPKHTDWNVEYIQMTQFHE